MFFASKIRATAEYMGVEIKFVRNNQSAVAATVENTAALVLVDLHSTRIDPLALAESLKNSDTTRNIPIIGFFSHVETELMRKALEAGFDQVIPRSVFANKLGEILSTIEPRSIDNLEPVE
jgi:PleD family two-component response regulator